jgi:cytochrome c oxidase subunit II
MLRSQQQQSTRGPMARTRGTVFYPFLRFGALLPLLALLAACSPTQSALHPAGEDAEALANLFWFMTFGGALVWAIVMGCAIYAVLGKKRPRSEKFADRYIFFGGVVFPTVGLAALLVFGLALLPDWAEADEADVRIHVAAEQYWWRIAYETPTGRVNAANEIHLPVNQTAEFVLTSTDVIHSFWVPALGGKMDVIPGRTNLWRLKPTKAGVYRGVCAEFCGPSHALMAFQVVVHEAEDYQAWLATETLPAIPTGGAEAFTAAGCGSCHTVRGLVEEGAVGPDLTHFASRRSLGADTLPITAETLHDWLVAPSHIKPGVRMPSFGTLPQADRDAIVAFLLELK